MSRIGVVLWNNVGRGLLGGFKKMRTQHQRSAAVLSKEGAGEASNLTWRPVQQGSRDTTTSACVGWDLANIENQSAFRKPALEPELSAAIGLRTAWPPPKIRWRSSRQSIPP